MHYRRISVIACKYGILLYPSNNFFDKILLQEVIHILHNVFHIFNPFIFYIYPAASNFVQLFFAHK